MFSIKLSDTKKREDNSRKFLGLYNNAFFEKNMKIREEIKQKIILWCNKITKSDTQLKIKNLDFYNENEKDKDLTYSSDSYVLQSMVVCGFVFALGFYMYRK